MKQRIHNHENKEDTAYSTLYDAGMGRRRETNSGSIEETRKPSGVMATGVKRNIVLSWLKGKRATGTEIYLYDKTKKKYRKKAVSKSSRHVIKGLKPGVNYCFKVRSFRKYKKKKYYSRFSKTVKVSMAARGEGRTGLKIF